MFQPSALGVRTLSGKLSWLVPSDSMILKGNSEPLNEGTAVIPNASAPPHSSDILALSDLCRLCNTAIYEAAASVVGNAFVDADPEQATFSARDCQWRYQWAEPSHCGGTAHLPRPNEIPRLCTTNVHIYRVISTSTGMPSRFLIAIRLQHGRLPVIRP